MLTSLRKIAVQCVATKNFSGIHGRRWLSSAQDAFERAQADLKKLPEEPDNETKLKIYALFKQDDAKKKYAELVTSLRGAAAEQQTSSGASVLGLDPVPGLDLSIEDKIFRITLNRPNKFNALTLEMYRGLTNALNAASKDKSTTVTVITGTGKYYCSGNDLSNFAALATAGKEEIRKTAEMAGTVMQAYVQAYIDHEKPLVSLINGPAVGISVTVLPLFDLVLASDAATFHTPFAALGQSPEACSSYTFPHLMGQLNAAEILLVGKKITAEEAQRRGLVNQVFPDTEFATSASKIVSAFSKLPPQSAKICKKLLRDPHRQKLTEINAIETETIKERWQSSECHAAIAAFMSRSKK
ncbi:hypothetical protein WR25_00968 [Diploscapter pachys]|uniref:ACB domain-containing protein n=1 Tax=Diploscapter pachys TaxID=2018661 RepID=A0A2A2JVU4_9BILA|nr:hypothetical protein WR25_00968 [Diploscapter pachys]